MYPWMQMWICQCVQTYFMHVLFTLCRSGRIPCAQTACRQTLCRNIMCDLPYPHVIIVMIMMITCSTVMRKMGTWPIHQCMPPRHATIRQIDLLVHIPRIFSSGRAWTFGILNNTLNFVNTNIFKYYYKNLLNIGENVPVADFGHYADYCAQLIPLSLLKSTLGGGDGARVMLHQNMLVVYFFSPMFEHATWYLYCIASNCHCANLKFKNCTMCKAHHQLCSIGPS